MWTNLLQAPRDQYQKMDVCSELVITNMSSESRVTM